MSTALAQGTAFTYQGQLQSATNLANGQFDISFSLYAVANGGSAVAGPVTNTAVNVTNGLFTTVVDFGNVFAGASNWLQIAVSTNAANAFGTLAPRQQLTPAPYAVFAESANATNLVGTVSTGNLSGVALLNGDNTFSGNQTFNNGNIGVGTAAPSALLANTANNIVGGDGWGLSSQSLGWYSDGFGYAAGFYNPGTGAASGGVVVGIQGTSAHILDLNAAGNSVMVVNGNGNVHVNGTVAATSFTGIGSSLTGVALLNGGNNFSGQQTVMNGNVGIGTITPRHKLDVDGNIFLGTAANGAVFTELGDTLYLGSPRKYLSSTLGAPIDGSTDWLNLMCHPFSQGIMFGTSGPSDTNPHSAPNPLMVIRSNGNVGIGLGATNPATTLQVAGSVGIGTTVNSSAELSIGQPGGLTQFELLKPGFNIGYQFATDSGGLDICERNVACGRFYIQNGTGNIGIGTAAPANLLDVQGSADFTGNVGIGTTTPGSPLTVVSHFAGIQQNFGGADVTMYVDPSDPSGVAAEIGSFGNVNFGLFVANQEPVLVLNTNGNVGIGTATPTKAALEIDGNNGSHPAYGSAGVLSSGGVTTRSVAGGPASIWAAGFVFADTFVAFSDARIKNIRGRSDSAADLDTLLGIQITDYTFKDTVARGDRPQKKVIAQQVEKVFPQAVNQSTDEVPDIYRSAAVKDGWVQLATDLKVGERVKLIGKKQEGIFPVLETRPGAFRTAFDPSTDKVFVYGRQVKDFRTVDYDAIAMLNVSATQELAKELAGQKAENAALKARLGKLEERETRVAAMEQEMAGLKNLVAQLAREGKNSKMAARATTPNHASANLRQPLVTASLDQ